MRARPNGPLWMIAVVLAVIAMEAAGAAAPAPPGIKGTVVDASAGVLPGVTVTAQAPDGRPLATTVTNAAGEFTFESLPAGQVTLLFHLDGFADAKATISISPAGSTGETLPNESCNGWSSRALRSQSPSAASRHRRHPRRASSRRCPSTIQPRSADRRKPRTRSRRSASSGRSGPADRRRCSPRATNW